MLSKITPMEEKKEGLMDVKNIDGGSFCGVRLEGWGSALSDHCKGSGAGLGNDLTSFGTGVGRKKEFRFSRSAL